MQVNPSTGLKVGGAWNNHEGLPSDYNQTYAQLLNASGYNVNVSAVKKRLCASPQRS